MTEPIAKTWWFESGSDPNKNYEALLYEDGTTSCNCPGWTRRTDDHGQRTCKHTRMVQSGLADQECIRSLENKGKSTPNNISLVLRSRPPARTERDLAAKDLKMDMGALYKEMEEIENKYPEMENLPPKQSGIAKVTKIHWKI